MDEATAYALYVEASDLYQLIWEIWLMEPGQTPRERKLWHAMKRAEVRRTRRGLTRDSARRRSEEVARA
jgi:hypothetical protein